MKTRIVLVCLLSATLVGGAALAQEDIVKERQQLMKDRSSGGAKLGSQMLKGQVPYDGEKLAAAMNGIAELPELFIPLLKPGTTVYEVKDSTLKPVVFTEMEDFKARMAKFAGDAKAAAAAAKAGQEQFREAFDVLTQNCKSCHDKFSTQ